MVTATGKRRLQDDKLFCKDMPDTSESRNQARIVCWSGLLQRDRPDSRQGMMIEDITNKPAIDACWAHCPCGDCWEDQDFHSKPEWLARNAEYLGVNYGRSN